MENLTVQMTVTREWRDAFIKAAADFGVYRRDFAAELIGMGLYEMGYLTHEQYFSGQVGRVEFGSSRKVWETAHRFMLQERERQEPHAS